MTENIEQPTTLQEPIISPSETPTSVQSESISESPLIEQPQTPIQPEPAPAVAPQPAQPPLESFLTKALESIQFRKKVKLEKIVKLANENKVITNDDVEKLLHVSDATATRHLSTLVKQNRLKVSGNRRSVRYEPINGSNGGN